MEKKSRGPIRTVLSYVKGLFLSGLFTIMPLIVTVFIITFTYSFIARWLEPMRKIIPMGLQAIPGSEFILVTLAIMVLGFLLRLVFITPIIHWFESLITKIPLIRSIYSSAKILVNFFNVPQSTSNQRKVVLVEFPRKGFFNLAFLLEPATDNFQNLIPQDQINPEKMYFKVFMPNCPNPTTGYFLILSEDEIVNTNITFDEAIKTLVSCGLITPDSIKKM